MFKVGQKVKTKLGFPVEIVAVLDRPDGQGYAVVGVRTVGGERDLASWTADGRYMVGRKSDGDLVIPPEIETICICPPIPDRRWDWMARYSDDDETGPHGFGPTLTEAVADLRDSYPREEAA
jgi:hypothetical protein